MKPIYLDFNTTTPLAPSVGEAMQPLWQEHFLLPSQGNAQGRALGELIVRAREEVAAMVGCEPYEIVFTSGATEANNLAILGLSRSWSERAGAPGEIIVSATEHDSVLSTAESLTKEGWTVRQAPVGRDGVTDPAAIERMLTKSTVLVCLQAACGISGAMQPVRQVADICHARRVHLHCDAAQVAGKYPLDIGNLRADTLALSSHKMYGPKGVGALYVRRGLQLAPIFHGESQEMGLRPGAGNLPGVVGMGAAARMAHLGGDAACEAMARLRDRFEARVTGAIKPTPVVLSQGSTRLPNTSLISFPGKQALEFDSPNCDVVLAQPRCSKPADWMTRCLLAMGIPEREVGRCVRVSLGWTSSHDSIDAAAGEFIGMFSD